MTVEAGTACPTCRYLVRRPPEVLSRCYLDGVCLRAGGAVGTRASGSGAACNSTCNLGAPDRATHWRERNWA